MKSYMFCLLFFWGIVFSCTKTTTRIRIDITNHSASPIDSIVIPFDKASVLTKIYPNETKEIVVNIPMKGNGREGLYPLTIFQQTKKFTAAWGFHEYGKFPKTEESFIFSDSGISAVNTGLQKK